MKTMYKLVSQDWTTHAGMKWVIGKTNKATGKGIRMCSADVLHCYASPEEAVLFNPIHAEINNPILLEICCSEIIASDGLKYACKEQTPIKQVSVPTLTLNQKAAFAIKCALLVYKSKEFVEWAENWLNETNRTYAAAADAADAAAADAADAARAAAARAAAARAAAADADAAAYAADAAAYASAHAQIDFKGIIQWVLDNIS